MLQPIFCEIGLDSRNASWASCSVCTSLRGPCPYIPRSPKVVPEEGKPADPAAEEERLETLRALARACKKQGAHQLACKKYTQAGDRVKAMKCLLKSGDTKNITYYANTSRNREIYVLAANYLQSLDWQNEPKTMKDIVLFYTKAKAWEQLSSFFDAYAQMEIDEYRDYEKALEALKKAATYMVSSTCTRTHTHTHTHTHTQRCVPTRSHTVHPNRNRTIISPCFPSDSFIPLFLADSRSRHALRTRNTCWPACSSASTTSSSS